MSVATAVKERPILFSGPMVRAILDGRKTQTRRVIKPQPTFDGYWWTYKHYSANGEKEFGDGMPIFGRCPYGFPGERLWVREAWSPDHAAFYPHFPVVYRSDFGPEYERNVRGEVYSSEQKAWYPFRWRPSIHMPRRLSRITLEITDVRAQRLHEISEEDAIVEGAQCAGCPAALTNYGAFGRLWQQINGAGSWAANPWVWAITFKRIEVTQ